MGLTIRARAGLASILVAVALAAVMAPPVLGADDTEVTFGKPDGSSKYGEQIEFVQALGPVRRTFDSAREARRRAGGG